MIDIVTHIQVTPNYSSKLILNLNYIMIINDDISPQFSQKRKQNP